MFGERWRQRVHGRWWTYTTVRFEYPISIWFCSFTSIESTFNPIRYGESAKNAPAYKPKQKELCVVRIKETEGYFWYRCIYQTELVDERAQVYCIDYGKVDTVRQNNIRVSVTFSITQIALAQSIAFFMISFDFFFNWNQAMTSGLEHEITSIVCFIKNGKSISDEKRVKYFNDQPEFKPLGIEYDQKTHQHVVTVDFSEVE